MSQSRILISVSQFGGYQPDPTEKLRVHFQVVKNPHGRRLAAEEIVALAASCEGLIAGLEPLSRSVLEALPALRCISRVGIGVDTIDLVYAKERGITVCTTPDAPTQAVAELTLGLILNLLRHVSRMDRQMRRTVWEKLKGVELSGKTVGVIGLGRIGRRVAELLLKLNARVIGSDHMHDPQWAARMGIAVLPLNELLKRSEILTLHASKEPGMPPILKAEELAQLKPGAFLVNVARGGLVDEEALLQALQTGHIAGAALDVFEREPYKGPLASLEQVILTPHVGSLTQESRALMEHEAADNLINILGSKHANAR